MPSLSIRSVYESFDDSVSRTARLLLNSTNARTPAGTPMHVRDIEEIAALCLLRLALSWESFVEDSFLRYLCGAASLQNAVPQNTGARSPSIGDAFKLLAGPNNYLAWPAAEITNRANQHFLAGGPYASAVGAASGILSEIQVVRNRMAHRSEFSKNRFTAVVRAHVGHVPRGTTPGRFLRMTTPVSGGVSVLEHYTGSLTITASVIANYR